MRYQFIFSHVNGPHMSSPWLARSALFQGVIWAPGCWANATVLKRGSQFWVPSTKDKIKKLPHHLSHPIGKNSQGHTYLQGRPAGQPRFRWQPWSVLTKKKKEGKELTEGKSKSLPRVPWPWGRSWRTRVALSSSMQQGSLRGGQRAPAGFDVLKVPVAPGSRSHTVAGWGLEVRIWGLGV